jgi:hypothetical protein
MRQLLQLLHKLAGQSAGLPIRFRTMEVRLEALSSGGRLEMALRVTKEMLDDERAENPILHVHEDFCREWIEKNCDNKQVDLMKAVRAWFWGPGTTVSETEYLAMRLGKQPSRAQVLKLMSETMAVVEAMEIAFSESKELSDLKRDKPHLFRGPPGK